MTTQQHGGEGGGEGGRGEQINVCLFIYGLTDEAGQRKEQMQE